MEVTPEQLLPRFVKDKNGSYCFGHNGILLQVLRGLGFRYGWLSLAFFFNVNHTQSILCECTSESILHRQYVHL